VTWEDGNVEVATGGLYAPTIRHHNGVTYIICTNVVHASTAPGDGDHTENFVVHTRDIWSGQWSDPVYYKFEGIDPSIFFDDDGKAYVQGTQMPQFHIYNMEMDLQTGEMLTEPKMVWAGWDKRYTEGPHLYKKDGWYYLLCAEGGTFTTHMISMARSRSIWGPFETYAQNPVWTAHGTQNYIQHTGHADLFQDRDGAWWIVMLGVRKEGARFVMGRESFISKVEWPSEGWPIVTPVASAVKGLDVAVRKAGSPIEVGKEGVDWLYLRDPAMKNYALSGNSVELLATPVDMSAPMDPVTFVGKRQRVLDGAASASLGIHGVAASTGLKAGLAMVKDEHRYIMIGYDFDRKEIFSSSTNRAKKIDRRESRSFTAQESIAFRIAYTAQEYRLEYSEEPQGAVASPVSWTLLGSVDTADVTGFDFTVRP
jgi:beta-xylosidase